jgi:hypothetical protein
MVGGALDPLFDQLSPVKKEDVMQDQLRRQPFIRRVMKATDPYTKFEKQAEEEKLKESDRRYEQRLEIDKLSEKWLDSRSRADKQAILRYIKDQDPTDKNRLMDRVKYNRAVHQLTDRRWWRTVQSATPEVRARIYWNRYKMSNAFQRRRLDKQLRELPGLASKRFRRELRRLKKGGATQGRLPGP